MQRTSIEQGAWYYFTVDLDFVGAVDWGPSAAIESSTGWSRTSTAIAIPPELEPPETA